MTRRFQKSSKARGTGTMERGLSEASIADPAAFLKGELSNIILLPLTGALAATKESLCRSVLTPALPTFLSELLNYPDATSNLQPTCGLLPRSFQQVPLCNFYLWDSNYVLSYKAKDFTPPFFVGQTFFSVVSMIFMG